MLQIINIYGRPWRVSRFLVNLFPMFYMFDSIVKFKKDV